MLQQSSYLTQCRITSGGPVQGTDCRAEEEDYYSWKSASLSRRQEGEAWGGPSEAPRRTSEAPEQGGYPEGYDSSPTWAVCPARKGIIHRVKLWEASQDWCLSAPQPDQGRVVPNALIIISRRLKIVLTYQLVVWQYPCFCFPNLECLLLTNLISVKWNLLNLLSCYACEMLVWVGISLSIFLSLTHLC